MLVPEGQDRSESWLFVSGLGCFSLNGSSGLGFGGLFGLGDWVNGGVVVFVLD